VEDMNALAAQIKSRATTIIGRYEMVIAAQEKIIESGAGHQYCPQTLISIAVMQRLQIFYDLGGFY
jgi:hypothetical protein